jgi:signal transduction histidine kinase
VLVAIDPGRLDRSLSSFAARRSLAEDLDRVMSSPHVDSVASRAWVWSARTCPGLARAIVAVGSMMPTSASDLSSGSAAKGILEFTRRPYWLGLADQLGKLDDQDLVAGEEFLLAPLALHVSLLTRWVRAEEAYWHALVQRVPVRRYTSSDELEILEPAERCRVVARWVLDAVMPDGPRTDRGGSLSPREAARALDSLAESTTEPFDVAVLIQEMDAARLRPTALLDRPSVRRLAALARLAGYRQDSRWHDELFQIVTGVAVEDVLSRSARLAKEWCDGSVALWLEGHSSREGWSIAEDPGTGYWNPPAFGSRESLEAEHLPAIYRCSRDLVAQEGRSLGRVYSDRSIQSPLAERWLGRLASALVAFWDRGGKDAAARISLRATTGANRDAINSKVRRAIGEFSAGAGHEINNPLGAIAGHASKLLKDEVIPDRRHALQQIHHQVGRIRKMIRDLQLIGGNLSLSKTPVELAGLIAQAAGEAEKRLTGGHLVWRSCPDDWRVVGDQELLSRMIAELLVNGGQAAGPAGEVTVWAERSTENPTAIEVVVRDSGPGLTSSQRQRAFLPFYSGREAGRGLGMGLPVAERIAMEHGGSILISHGKPTTVRIQLPGEFKQAS